jgi:hypothetical protein
MKSFNITYSKIPMPSGLTYFFEWDDGEKKIFIPVSLHGAESLADHFKSVGYENKTEIENHNLNLL